MIDARIFLRSSHFDKHQHKAGYMAFKDAAYPALCTTTLDKREDWLVMTKDTFVAQQDDTIEIVPSTVLDLRNTHDRADFDTLILFLSYVADYGVSAYVTLAIARDLYNGQLVGDVPPSSDAAKIFARAHEDIDRTDTNMTLADVVGVFGTLATSLFGGEPAPEPKPATKPQAPVTYDLRKVAAGAPSLALLVEYANRVPRAVFPAQAIPSPSFVKRCLAIFHWMKQQEMVEEMADVDEATRDAEDDSQPGTTPAAAIEGAIVSSEN